MVEYVGSAEGTFDFTMAMYQDSSFATALTRGDAISVGTPVYVKIDFLSTTELSMFVQDCYATPVEGQGSALQYKLIDVGG